MGKKTLQGNLDIEGSLWLSGDVTVGGNAEEAAKKLATENYVDTQMSGVETYIDQKVIDKTTGLESRLNSVEEIAKGAAHSEVYDEYKKMIAALNVAEANFLEVSDHILIRTILVPDLWVMFVDNHSVPYEYTTDQAIVDAVYNGTIQVGYFVLSALETQKVVLDDYVMKKDATTVKATLKDNGAYTLTIIQGVE